MANIYLFRRKTAADWTSANPVLLSGELGLETDTTKFKFGNGTTAWNSLAYAGASVGAVPWGAITGTLSSQVDLQAALDLKATASTLALIASSGSASDLVAGTVPTARLPTALQPTPKGVADFAAENVQGLLPALEVTAAASARFAGAWRARDVGEINWYFVGQAMTLTPEAFPEASRQTFCEVAIDKGVVSPRQSTAAYGQYTMVTFASGKVYFCNIAGTTTSPAPSDAAITTAGQTLGDGTVTWEYTGLQVPASWQWFLVDVGSNLATILAPDSTDAYPAMLASAAELANVDAAWLNTASAHPGQTRMGVINLLIQNGMTDDLTGVSPGARLSYVFQNQLDPAGGAYTIRYLADNVEVWRGYIAQAALLDIVGSSPTAALQNAADVKTGILSTQLFDSGRFKAYVGRPNWDTITGDAVYATDFRFHLFPALYGLLSSVAEWANYGAAVAGYIRDNVPGLFNASLDTFPMVEGYWALWRMGWIAAKDTAFWRVITRATANVVITDAAFMAVWLGLTYADPVVGGGGGITALTGDVTASGSGSVAATIAADAVTNAKLANMATQTFKGRTTAGTGDPEDLTVAQAKTLLNLTGTNSGDQTITLTSDVTGSGTGSFATTIAAGAVTLAKMANLATDRLIGRDTAGTGVPEALTVGGGVEFTGTGGIQTSAFTGDATKTAGGTALTLATVNANVGAFGSATQVATFTVNAKGLTTAAGVTTISIPMTAISDSTAAGRSVLGAASATAQTALFDVFTSGAKGLAPASGGGTTNFLRADGTWAAAGGGSPVTVQDEGVNITTALGTLNFVGAGVTVTGGATATVTIAGGGGSGISMGVNYAFDRGFYF